LENLRRVGVENFWKSQVGDFPISPGFVESFFVVCKHSDLKCIYMGD